jgi:thiamine kinase-like enzyme
MEKQGAFGRITQSSTPQRILKVPHTNDPSTRYMHALENEARVLKFLTKKRLTCIPHFHGVTTQKQEGFPALQMQYLPISQSDVRSYLKDLSLDQFHDFLMHCFASLDQLHRYALHMDLHRGNVMFRPPNSEVRFPQLVFIDFGYSVMLNNVLKNYPSSDDHIHALIETYKKYERYELYGILVGMYEDQQQQRLSQRPQVHMIQSIPNVPHRFHGTKEEDMVQQFHDTCRTMINQGQWS